MKLVHETESSSSSSSLNLVVFLCLPLANVAVAKPFLGDMPWTEYIERWCTEWRSSKTELIVVDRRNGNHSLSGRFQSNLFNKLHCDHHRFQVGPSNSLSKVHQEIVKSKQFQYKKLLVLIRLTWRMNQEEFGDLLAQLDRFYWHCLACFPLLVSGHFDQSNWHEVLGWARSARTHRSFRAVLVGRPDDWPDDEASRSSSSFSIHIRPVLNGCALLDRVVLIRAEDGQPIGGGVGPKTSLQRAMAVPTKYCNLDGATLNVSVNHVSKMNLCFGQFGFQFFGFNRQQNQPSCALTTTNAHNHNRTELTESIYYHLLMLYQQRFNFRSHFIDEQGVFGAMVNGSYIGIIGSVHDQVGRRILVILSFLNHFRTLFI